jgi:hypothetical protein
VSVVGRYAKLTATPGRGGELAEKVARGSPSSAREVRRLDAVRIVPGSTRAFEAGPDGLEFLALGTHQAGDAQMRPGFWPA